MFFVAAAAGDWYGAAMTTLPRVLVVDDEPAVGIAATTALRDGHDVSVLSSGAEAVRALREGGAWDVILCKPNMPGIDGAAVYTWLLREAPLQAERFLFMADAAGSAAIDGLGAQVAPMPAEHARLREVVSSALARRGRRAMS
jgi:CheY-like chemotaxis protein